MKNDWIYDIETYLDLFCVDFTHVETRTRYIFEVSDRVNQSPQFIRFLCRLRDEGARLFGFNNEGFRLARVSVPYVRQPWILRGDRRAS